MLHWRALYAFRTTRYGSRSRRRSMEPAIAGAYPHRPLNLENYLDFLPNGSAYEPLRSLLRFWTNEEIDFEVQLILKREEVPPCQLGGEGDGAPQLGWVTWMKSKPMERHPEETIFNA